MELIFEKSKSDGEKGGAYLPQCDVPEVSLPKELLRDKLSLPELAELEVVRHYLALSRRNMGVDVGFYPLGSCTMKYNPKINEKLARDPGFAALHPLAEEAAAQGALAMLYELEEYLCAITGMEAYCLQPSAGAHGEMMGMMLMRAYFEDKGERRTKILVPDSSHGTNPASAALCGFEVVQIKSDQRGNVDMQDLRDNLGVDTAGIMMTNPNTLGLFEEKILEIAELVHGAGALLYYDGANMNALLGQCRPGDMGFDVVHLNLHKTFSTPHGGGGPGSGPVGVCKRLEPFLPLPRLVKKGDAYVWGEDKNKSIGRITTFHGNFAVMLKAYYYIRALGADGLKRVSEDAVLNANYLLELIREKYPPGYQRRVMHEFVVPATPQKEKGGSALDVAKRLIDYGYHPPTVYFPLIVPEALMVEPTETEGKKTLEAFAAAMLKIDEEIEQDAAAVREAPTTTPVSRLDEVKAARELDICYKDQE